MLISCLRDEIAFFREKICQKNNIINKFLTENPLMRDERNFLFRSQNKFDNHEQTKTPDFVESQSNIHSHGERTKHLLNDQLITINAKT